ncbi:MAG: hypothetical protein RBS85_07280 [Methanofastidiosum sp.]|jgi:flagellin-like protein|nr:hypothetical protein [Methanofastidiosum sp.]
MMKFFRKHRKAVSPVIAVMLLVAVAVAAVGAYFIWFRSFQTQTQGSVQEAASGALGTGLQVLGISNDETNYYITLRNASNYNSSHPINFKVSGVLATVTAPTEGTTEETPTEGNSVLGKGVTKTFTITAPTKPARGTSRVFTIESNVSTLTHTYADA